MKASPLPNVSSVREKIYLIRGHKVLLDRDLAELYGVETKVLNQAVKRNSKRFPEDFMFCLEQNEVDSLRSQFVTLKNPARGTHRKYLPFAFTEHGVAMLSGVLKSDRAIEVNIRIMRAFVELRHLIQNNKELWSKMQEMESKYDKQFKIVFDAMRELLQPPAAPKLDFKIKDIRRVSFRRDPLLLKGFLAEQKRPIIGHHGYKDCKA